LKEGLTRYRLRFPECSQVATVLLKCLAKIGNLFQYRWSVRVILDANRRTSRGHGPGRRNTYGMKVCRTCDTVVDT
jgi:hypothetical protein